jgi:hypothetical protein
MEIRCDHCGTDLWIDDARAGEPVQCPCCEKVFAAKEPVERLKPLTDLVDSLLAELPSVTATKITALPKSKPEKRKVRRRYLKPALLAAASVGVFGTSIVLVRFASHWLANPQTAAQSTSGAEAEIAVWEPDSGLLDQLGESKAVAGFSFRPPIGFTNFNVLPEPKWLPREAKFIGLEWQGPEGEKAPLRCLIVTFSPWEPLEGGLVQAKERFFRWIETNAALMNVSHKSEEVRILNGRLCLRASFSGSYRHKAKLQAEPREGIVFIMLDGSRQISLYTLCSPDAQRSLKILEASMLTWRSQ